LDDFQVMWVMAQPVSVDFQVNGNAAHYA